MGIWPQRGALGAGWSQAESLLREASNMMNNNTILQTFDYEARETAVNFFIDKE